MCRCKHCFPGLYIQISKRLGFQRDGKSLGFWVPNRGESALLAHDFNEQAQQRMETLLSPMQSAEGITEGLKAVDPMSWTQRMNNITARAEEIIREELIYT